MKIAFTSEGFDELLGLQRDEPAAAKKLVRLIRDIQREPFGGIGKPEALRGNLSGYWSRRITEEHRIVYRISTTLDGDQECLIIRCRYHY